MLENIGRVADCTDGLDRASFLADRLRRDAVERCIEPISEAAKKLDTVAEDWMPEHDWHPIRAVGNVLRHAYDDVDPDIIWRIAVEDVPRLAASIRRALRQIGSDPPD